MEEHEWRMRDGGGGIEEAGWRMRRRRRRRRRMRKMRMRKMRIEVDKLG